MLTTAAVLFGSCVPRIFLLLIVPLAIPIICFCGSVFSFFPYNGRFRTTQNIPHQYLFPHPNNENAVPDHYYSSSEGSDAQSCVAPATAEAFISDGSPNSGIAHLAANDEPYMPPRPHATTTTANPSPLHYTLPPDYVASHIGHSISVSLLFSNSLKKCFVD